MHFDVDLLPDGRIQITSHPSGDDERAHFRQAYARDSDHQFCGMRMHEIASLEGFVTANDGTGKVVSKSLRATGKPGYTGDLPSWVRKQT